MTGTSCPSFCSAELLRRPILRAIGGQIVYWETSLPMVMLTFWRALKDGEATEKLHGGGAATASETKDGEATEDMKD